MKLSVAQTKSLRAVSRGRSRTALKRLFALIREHDDRVLLAAALPAAKKKTRRTSDPMVREIERTLKPLMAPAAEKAGMLVEHIAKKHRRKMGLAPRSLAEAARQLRGKFSDEEIRAGAKSLMRRLAKLYGERETVM